MTTLLGMHKKVDNRRRMEQDLSVMRMQLAQRDAVLWCLLTKHGKQTLTNDELGAFKEGCCIRCESVGDSVTFEVVNEKGGEDGEVKQEGSGEQSEGQAVGQVSM